MKGYRKLFLSLIILSISIYLVLNEKFTPEMANFLQWLFGLFAGSNILEHTIESYERTKRKIDSDISNSYDDIKSRVENAIKDNS
ncbi:MAG: hypothetical protein RMJ67_06040 [Elusimicrobiota bacterium]|nr:hypothetical protein [Endomicrobiia bacterium]MDW8166053.1 hypothetical protein [Elusimicrobiota bacterium]